MAGRWKKIVIFIVLAVLIGLFFALDLQRFLTLAELKARQEAFQGYYAAHRLMTLAAYFLLYLAVTALSLPGAAVMTLAGGALFGFWPALVVVSFASTIGATLAFLVSRFLLRDWVQERFGERLKTVNAGIEREGAFYLFSLRLVPLFPFFVINLVMGLTPMPDLDLLLGQPARHAGGHGGLRQRRHPARPGSNISPASSPPGCSSPSSCSGSSRCWPKRFSTCSSRAKAWPGFPSRNASTTTWW